VGVVVQQSSTLFTVGTLLRHAQEAGTPVRVLVQGQWLDGQVIGADGMGVILDDGGSQQVLVKLDQIVAVTFSQANIQGHQDEPEARASWVSPREPIEAGPVSR
jgi:sRNA-binding regulator protein Hfq